MLKKNLEVLALLVAFCGPAYAEDGAGDGGDLMYVAYEAAAEPTNGGTLSCKEARDSAWFEREVARTDGNVDPDEKYGSCGHEILAESTADID